MKKQILALMACAAFLTPTSGFCMENDEREQKNSLNILPKDCHLVILDNLSEATDVVSLKRVSQYFCELVNKEKSIIPVEIVYKNTHHGRIPDYYNESFFLFLEEENKKSLTRLGYFEAGIPAQGKTKVQKKMVILPTSVKRGGFLARKGERTGSYFYYEAGNNIPSYLSEISGASAISLEIHLSSMVGGMGMFSPDISHHIHSPKEAQPAQK